jgi:hypothetical protein
MRGSFAGCCASADAFTLTPPLKFWRLSYLLIPAFVGYQSIQNLLSDVLSSCSAVMPSSRRF